MSHTPGTSVPGIGPVSHWLAHPAQGVRSVFWFSFCKDIARKVNNKGKFSGNWSVVAMVMSFAVNKGALWGNPGVLVLAG